MSQPKRQEGFTLIELLVVLVIFAILVIIVMISVNRFLKKGNDVRIQNDVGQMRLLAEQAYDANGASYIGWKSHPLVVSDVQVLLADINEVHHEPPNSTEKVVFLDSQRKNYCISVELVIKDDGAYYCVDASGVYRVVSAPCEAPVSGDIPLACPGN
ncbi:MAG: type II secretion system protein [Candidatus Andersenbacteria bacterium]